MPFPWSIVIGFVLFGVGVGLLVAGVLADGAEALADYGWAITGAGMGVLGGKGIATVEAARPPV